MSRKNKPGRNDHCPKCGKKMKDCKGHKVNKLALFIIATIMVTAIAAIIFLHAPVSSGTRQVKYAFEKFHTTPTEWMDSDDCYNYYLQCLSDYAALTKDTKELYHFFMERKRRAVLEGDAIIAKENGPRSGTIWVVIGNKWDGDPRSAPFLFDSSQPNIPGSGIIFLPPFKVSRQWAAAALFHEISHAYDILTGKEPPKLPINDYRYLFGEVRAHEIETEFLDTITSGGLSKAIADLNEGDLIHFKNGVLVPNEEAMFKMNKLFVSTFSPPELSVRIAHTITAINFYQVNSSSLRGEGLLRAKALRYLMVRETAIEP